MPKERKPQRPCATKLGNVTMMQHVCQDGYFRHQDCLLCCLWLQQVMPKERRTQLFSATMTSKVAKLQRACLDNPVKVEVDAKYRTVDTLRQQYLFIPAKHKVRSTAPSLLFALPLLGPYNSDACSE